VGQWRGSGDVGAAKKAASEILKLCVFSVAPFFFVFFFCSSTGSSGFIGTIAGGISADPRVINAAASYLRWNALGLFFLAVEAVAEGAFTGAGNTFPVLVVGAFFNCARVPLARYLAFDLRWGITGVWVTIVWSQIGKAVVKWWWFQNRGLKD
jgi:Na+-driven multidrug efflux pump